ncbi:MAG: hypothetical protein HQL22_05765 [Candidatus Omnitrophica bacterium]|nr:hypothetical protein [Candidatus Omnitrophota bacterium]
MRSKHFLVVSFAVLAGLMLVLPSFAQELPAGEAASGEAVAAVPMSQSALELSIVPSSQTVQIGDKVKFELVLTNTGKGAMKVRKLDEQSLFCNFNGLEWGAKDPSGEPVVILMPGDVIRKKFKVSGTDVPGDFKVSCTYGMGINGVRPKAETTFTIVR